MYGRFTADLIFVKVVSINWNRMILRGLFAIVSRRELKIGWSLVPSHSGLL